MLINLQIHSKTNPSKKEDNDDAFIDDEDSSEGSGHGKNKFDLESSGSGYGLFDEDDEHDLGPSMSFWQFSYFQLLNCIGWITK